MVFAYDTPTLLTMVSPGGTPICNLHFLEWKLCVCVYIYGNYIWHGILQLVGWWSLRLYMVGLLVAAVGLVQKIDRTTVRNQYKVRMEPTNRVCTWTDISVDIAHRIGGQPREVQLEFHSFLLPCLSSGQYYIILQPNMNMIDYICINIII